MIKQKPDLVNAKEQTTATQILSVNERCSKHCFERVQDLTKHWHLNKTKRKVINSCAGDHSKSEPPDPFPNSEVKPLSADSSVGLPM